MSSTAAMQTSVATRRRNRLASSSNRPFSSPAAVRSVGRPPIVLEWSSGGSGSSSSSSSQVLRVGYAEQSQPQHIIPVQIPQSTLDKPTDELEEESYWYDMVVPIVRQAFDRLMVDPTTRRVVVIASPHPNRYWEAALQQSLWNLGVPAVAVLNPLQLIPLAHGWNRALVVHVGLDESHFLAHVDGHPLEFTYQVVPTGYASAVDDADTIQSTWNSATMDKAWLDDHNPNSLVNGLLNCLKESPTDARKQLISNIVVCGDTPTIVPDLGRRLALKVKQVLSSTSTDSNTDETTTTITATENHDPVMTMIPLATHQLQPLADHVGVLSCAPLRPDLMAWVGGSVYSTIWHRHGDDQGGSTSTGGSMNGQVPWKFAPAAKTI